MACGEGWRFRLEKAEVWRPRCTEEGFILRSSGTRPREAKVHLCTTEEDRELLSRATLRVSISEEGERGCLERERERGVERVVLRRRKGSPAQTQHNAAQRSRDEERSFSSSPARCSRAGYTIAEAFSGSSGNKAKNNRSWNSLLNAHGFEQSFVMIFFFSLDPCVAGGCICTPLIPSANVRVRHRR